MRLRRLLPGRARAAGRHVRRKTDDGRELFLLSSLNIDITLHNKKAVNLKSELQIGGGTYISI